MCTCYSNATVDVGRTDDGIPRGEFLLETGLEIRDLTKSIGSVNESLQQRTRDFAVVDRPPCSAGEKLFLARVQPVAAALPVA